MRDLLHNPCPRLFGIRVTFEDLGSLGELIAAAPVEPVSKNSQTYTYSSITDMESKLASFSTDSRLKILAISS